MVERKVIVESMNDGKSFMRVYVSFINNDIENSPLYYFDRIIIEASISIGCRYFNHFIIVIHYNKVITEQKRCVPSSRLVFL